MTEYDEQVALFRWARLYEDKYPELELMFHPPNGGFRHKTVAAKMKAQGAKAGVPDVVLPVPRQGYGALFIEMKTKKGRMQESQKQWYEALTLAGNKVLVCRSWIEAREAILRYLGYEAGE